MFKKYLIYFAIRGKLSYDDNYSRAMFNILHDKVYNSGILRDKTIKDKLMYVQVQYTIIESK